MPPARRPRRGERRKREVMRRNNFSLALELDEQLQKDDVVKVIQRPNLELSEGRTTAFHDRAFGTREPIDGAELIGSIIIEKKSKPGGNGDRPRTETTYWYIDRRGRRKRGGSELKARPGVEPGPRVDGVPVVDVPYTRQDWRYEKRQLPGGELELRHCVLTLPVSFGDSKEKFVVSHIPYLLSMTGFENVPRDEIGFHETKSFATEREALAYHKGLLQKFNPRRPRKKRGE